MKVLIVDDQPSMRMFMGQVVGRGHEVAGEASNGAEAVNAVRKLLPDVVFLDIEMPVKNGIDACREIKAGYPNVIVIMVTTKNKEDMIEKAFDAGADDYITKPIMPAEVLAKLSGIEDDQNSD
jgi:two-component system chemotaxis response regulator CheY